MCGATIQSVVAMATRALLVTAASSAASLRTSCMWCVRRAVTASVICVAAWHEQNEAMHPCPGTAGVL